LLFDLQKKIKKGGKKKIRDTHRERRGGDGGTPNPPNRGMGRGGPKF